MKQISSSSCMWRSTTLLGTSPGLKKKSIRFGTVCKVVIPGLKQEDLLFRVKCQQLQQVTQQIQLKFLTKNKQTKSCTSFKPNEKHFSNTT